MTNPATRAVSILLTVTLILTTLVTGPVPVLGAAPLQQQATPTNPSQASTPLTYNQAKTQLDATLKQIAALRKLIDRTQFDLGALSFALGGDPKQVINFVTDEIAFEQYPGLLRGAQGTLMSRAGNALDQAVLLHHLLTDAGYEAQILHGRLDEPTARTLVRQIFKPRKPALPISKQMDKLKQLLNDMVTKSGLSKTEIDRILQLTLSPPPVTATLAYSYTRADTDYVQAQLKQAGVTLGDKAAETKLVEEAKDYFWVEYRLNSSQKWQLVYPGFGATTPAKLTVTETFADESKIPETLQQRFQMQVLIEHKVGDAIETKPLFAPLQASAANLLGKRYTFAIIPDGYSKPEDFADPTAALKRSKLFYPALNGVLVKDAQFFDLLGNLIPPDAASSPLAQLIPGISGALGSAIDALGNSDNASPNAKDSDHFLLTGVYIEYTFTAPGQEPRVFRRTIVDRIGAANRANKQWKLLHADDPLPDLLELTANYTFMLAPSRVPEAYLADDQLGHLVGEQPLFDFALKTDYQQPGIQNIANAHLDKVDLSWPGHTLIYANFDEGAAALNQVNYRPTPSLVIYKQWQTSDRAKAWMDVVNNQRRAYKLTGNTLAVDTNALLTTGVWETRLEGVALSPEAARQENVFTVFTQAEQQKIPIHVLTPTDRSALANLKLDANAQPQVQADLDAGYLLVLPEQLPNGAQELHWWRIDPSTGQTLGVNEQGLGAVTIEYTVLIRSIALAGGCGVFAYADKNGLTVQDAIVCASVGVGGYGGMATLGATGKLIVAAAAMVGTGAWLNNSDGLQHPIIKP